MERESEQRLIWDLLFYISTRQATTIRQLCQRMGGDPLAAKYIPQCIFRLVHAELLQWQSPDGAHDDCPLALTQRCLELQSTLGLDIRLLAQLSHRDSMCVRPLFGRASRSEDPSDLFVVMPFRDHLQHVYDIHIKSVAGRLGLSVSRGDRWRQDHDIVQNIWEAICSSRLVIADCTTSNPNVFYEIGIAHCVGKPVILITQESEIMPHDLRHLRHLAYMANPKGLVKLEADLETAIRESLLLRDLS
jgi:hypothetical protein